MPDVRSSDESRSNISPNNIGDDEEAESHRVARLKRNKMMQGRRNRAIERKEVWTKYKADLEEYHRKKAEREAEDRHTASKPHNDYYNKIRELAQELEAICRPNEEQGRSEKLSGQPLDSLKKNKLIKNNLPDLFLKGMVVKASANLLLRG